MPPFHGLCKSINNRSPSHILAGMLLLSIECGENLACGPMEQDWWLERQQDQSFPK